MSMHNTQQQTPWFFFQTELLIFMITTLLLQNFFLQVKKIKRERLFKKVPAPRSIILFFYGPAFFLKKEFLFLQRNV